MILKLSITIFVIQVVFIWSRTVNVRFIASGNIFGVLASGAVIHISWLISIAIGAASMHEIITNFEWKFLPVVLCSLAGGLIGSYIGMKAKEKQ